MKHHNGSPRRLRSLRKKNTTLFWLPGDKQLEIPAADLHSPEASPGSLNDPLSRQHICATWFSGQTAHIESRSSAIVATVEFTDAEAAMEALDRFSGGTIRHTTLQPDIIVQLSAAVED